MRAAVLTVANPFDPLGSRSLRLLRRRARVRSLAPRTARPFLAFLNGRPLLRAGWRRRLADGDVVVFCVLPRGDRSNPLRLIASLAVMFFAPFAAAGLLGTTAQLVGTTLIGKLTTLGIVLAGQALINALLPMPKPQELPAASPTYTLGAQGNSARIEQPIPVQYGRLLVWPDFAAQPYAEYAGNEQYLYQLLCLGVGQFEVEDIRIEDTPVASFAEIETELVGPGEQVTLFPTAVITSPEVSGQVLAGRTTGTWSRSGATVTVTETAHGRAVGQAVRLDFTTGGGPTGVYAIATVPGEDSFTVTTASGSGSGDVLVHAVLGGEAGFTASAAGTRARHLAVDLVLPRGLYGYDDGTLEDRTLGVTVEARRVDDAGDPLGDWVVLGSVTLTDRTTTPIRRSYRWPVSPAGRYRVRAWRTDAQDAEAGNGHEVLLAGLRAYLREDQDFGPVTLLAMRMRASNNLSLQASRKVGVVCTRKIPVWTGSGWSAPVASRSIAWAIADATRDAAYGAGLADAALDLEALLALDAVWTARGDRFDGRFETASSWWEAITRIAAAGRARIFMQGGILRCVRDAPADVPVALYSMRNIRRGSFGIDYLLPGSETASRVEVTYFDATTWSQRRVVAKLPGSAGQVPAKLDLFGVTGRDQALREGLYHAATNRYRRRIVRFATEMEGFIPSLLDLIAIQHDMPGWAQHAEAVAWHGPTRTLTLSEPVVFGSGAHYVGLRTRSGGLAGPFGATPGAVPGQVVLDATPDEPVETGSSRERTHVTFGRGEAWRVLARVVSVRPRGPYDVEIEAVVEDPSVHGADEGQTAQPLRPSSLPRRATVPVVSGLIARRLPGNLSRAVLSWQPAAGADSYQIEMAEGADPAAAGITWSRIADTTATDHVVTLLWASRTIVRVRAIGLAAGPWTAAVLGSLIEDMWSASAATPMWTTDPALMWSS